MSQIYKCKFGYDVDARWKELAPDQQQLVRDRFPDELAGVTDTFPWYMDVICNAEDIAFLTDLGLPVTVHRVKGLAYQPFGTDPRGQAEAERAGAQIVNNVHVPNTGLWCIKKVTWVEDCCTQALQAWLDTGWLIIAVCPPNDTRRPTYILGHNDREAKEE